MYTYKIYILIPVSDSRKERYRAAAIHKNVGAFEWWPEAGRRTGPIVYITRCNNNGICSRWYRNVYTGMPVVLHATVLAFLFRQFDRASLDAIMPTNIPFPRRHSRSPDSYRAHLRQRPETVYRDFTFLPRETSSRAKSSSSDFHGGNRLTLFRTRLSWIFAEFVAICYVALSIVIYRKSSRLRNIDKFFIP